MTETENNRLVANGWLKGWLKRLDANLFRYEPGMGWYERGMGWYKYILSVFSIIEYYIRIGSACIAIGNAIGLLYLNIGIISGLVLLGFLGL